MCENMPTLAGVCVRFKRSDNQSGPAGRETDYLIMTFSSIEASVSIEGIYQLNINTFIW